MAASQRSKAASTNKRGGAAAAVPTAVDRYLRDLQGAPLAARTKDAYGQHVAAYAAWLSGRRDGEVALSDPRARDYAARDFKQREPLAQAAPRALSDDSSGRCCGRRRARGRGIGRS